MLTEIADICPDCFSFRYQESGCPDCGYRVPEPGKEGPALPVRTMLLNGRYMVGKVIGIGGCGITYKAFDMLYREVCAIKEFMPQGLAGRVPGSRDLQVYRASDQAAYRHGLERFIQENDIDIAVLTIPKTSAVPVAERLAKTDIRAIWNFAHVDLNLPERIQVENVHLSDSLMKLSYNIRKGQNPAEAAEGGM